MKRLATAGVTAAISFGIGFISAPRAHSANSTASAPSNLSVTRAPGGETIIQTGPAAVPQSPVAEPESKAVAEPQPNLSIPGLPHAAPESETSTAGPAQQFPIDTRPLWQLLRLHQYDALQQHIAVLKKYYPGWQPPGDLLHYLEVGLAQRAIDRATAAKNAAGVLAAYKRWPQVFDCQPIAHMWKLADAERAPGHADRSVLDYRDIFSTSSKEDDRPATLSRVVEQFPPQQVAPLVVAEANRASKAKAAKAYAEIRYRFYSKWLYAAAGQSHWPAAEQAAKAIEPDIKARKDANAAATIGWMELKQNKPALAQPWFDASFGWSPKPDTALGLALSLRALGKADLALAVASRFPHDAKLIALRQDILANAVSTSYIAGHYGKVLHLVAESTKLGPLRPDVDLFRAWAYYQKGDAVAAAPIFDRLYRQNRGAPAALGVIFSAIRLKHYRQTMALANQYPGALTAILEPEKGIKLKTAKQAVVRLGATTVPPDTRYVFFSAWLYDAMTAAHYKTADWIVQKIQNDIRAKHSDRLEASVGWVEVNVKKYGAAAAWFKDALSDASPNWPGAEDAAYGLALAQMKNGDYDAAAATAKAWSNRSARLKQFYGEVLMEHARSTYGAGHYTQSLKLARLAQGALPGRRDPKMLEAWDNYHLGQYSTAERIFEALYRAQPDQESASGLAFTLQRMGELDKLTHIAQEVPGPLRGLATSVVAEQEYNSGQFLHAARRAPEKFPMLAGITAPAAGAGFEWWSKSGASGTSRLSGEIATAQAQIIRDYDRFTVALNVINLNAGGIARAQEVNTLGSVSATKRARFAATTSLRNSVMPVIGWSREGAISPFAEIGATPLNGQAPSTIIGKLGLGFTVAGTQVTATAFRHPVTESILSLTGIVDPATGTTFGRVVESGGSVSLFHQFGAHWGVALSGSFGERTGLHVETNRHLSGSASFDYSLSPLPFKYISVGPSYQYENFQHNLSGFTFGNGGYYSPQRFHKIGMAVNFQTLDARRFVVKGSAFAGWQTAFQDRAPLFPLAPTSAFTAATTGSGPNYYLSTDAIYRLSSHWALQGDVSYQRSPQYNSVVVGVQLRFNFGARTKLLSTDLWAPTLP